MQILSRHGSGPRIDRLTQIHCCIVSPQNRPVIVVKEWIEQGGGRGRWEVTSDAAIVAQMTAALYESAERMGVAVEPGANLRREDGDRAFIALAMEAR